MISKNRQSLVEMIKWLQQFPQDALVDYTCELSSAHARSTINLTSSFVVELKGKDSTFHVCTRTS
jgi:hypothetical protein